jgi:hypothetical protein
VFFARPAKGTGQESLRVGRVPASTHDLAKAYAAAAQLATPGVQTTQHAVTGVRGARDCWLVTSTYHLPTATNRSELESLDLFCMRRNNSIAHLNLVVPSGDSSRDLARRVKSGLKV